LEFCWANKPNGSAVINFLLWNRYWIAHALKDVDVWLSYWFQNTFLFGVRTTMRTKPTRQTSQQWEQVQP
jgi:hypothetical protein